LFLFLSKCQVFFISLFPAEAQNSFLRYWNEIVPEFYPKRTNLPETSKAFRNAGKRGSTSPNATISKSDFGEDNFLE